MITIGTIITITILFVGRVSLTHFNIKSVFSFCKLLFFGILSGFSILRMYNYSIGQETFQGAVKKFVSERLNREVSIFNDCIEDMSKEASSDPNEIQVKEFISSWEAMEKYPVLNVTKNYTSGEIRVDHIQFSFADEAPHQPVSIPIWYTNSSSRQFSEATLSWIIAPYNSTTIKNAFESMDHLPKIEIASEDEGNETRIIEEEEDEEKPSSWVILNPLGLGKKNNYRNFWSHKKKSQTIFNISQILGYYRVNYDVATWKEFARILKEEPDQFPYYTRALLIDDSLNLARLGLLNYSVAFEIAGYLSINETNYWPWKEAFANLRFLHNILRDRPGFEVVEVSKITKLAFMYTFVTDALNIYIYAVLHD